MNRCLTTLESISSGWKVVSPSIKSCLDVLVSLPVNLQGDESALTQWRVWRDHSIEKYREEYARLNVSFDVYSGESQVSSQSQMEPLERLEKMGLVSDEKGAKLVDLTKWKLEKAVVRKKGVSTSAPLICSSSHVFHIRWNIYLPHP